jgi:hypothetical protein
LERIQKDVECPAVKIALSNGATGTQHPVPALMRDSEVQRREGNTIQYQVQKTASRMVFLLLVGYCVINAATVIGYSARQLGNPWENTYFESPQTYAAIYGAQTGKLYIPMSEPPYTPQAYTPLYYAINAWTARLAHLDVDRFVLYARVITFIAFLLSGLMVYLICRIAAVPRHYSILAALMMLGQPDFFGWNISPRPDMLYILAMLVSLFCVVKWEDRLWLGYGLAGFFAGIAFLIKQPGLAVASAIFFVVIIQREFKKAVVLTVCAVAPVVITFCVLYWRQDPFLQQLGFVGNSLWSVAEAAGFAREHLITTYWFLPAGIGLLGFFQAVKMDGRSKMIAAFALMNCVMGFGTLPQVGGYLNYLLPALAGCALLLPYAIRTIQEQTLSTTTMILIGIILVLATSSSSRYARDMAYYFVPPSQSSLDWLHPYRVLSDLTTMNVHGREPNLLDPFGAHVLELTGHWDSTPLLENLNNGKYDLIIFTRVSMFHFIPSFRGISYLGPAEIKAVNEKYEVLCSTLSQYVLRPRGREVAATPEMFGKLFNTPCGTGYRALPMDIRLRPNTR